MPIFTHYGRIDETYQPVTLYDRHPPGCSHFRPAFGQKRDRLAQADKVFAIGEYHRAIDKYKKAYSKRRTPTGRTKSP